MSYRILFVALLATAMGQSVVLTILPSLGRETGLSELQVSAILSSSALVFAVGSTLWSRLARRLGYRQTLMIGLTGYSLGTLVFAGVFAFGLAGWLTGSGLFTALLLARTGQSCVMSATPSSAVGYALNLARQQDHKLVAAVSKVTAANNLGQVLGPALAGLLVFMGLVVPLFAIILLTLIALVLVARHLVDLREAPFIPAESVPGQQSLDFILYLLIVMAAGLFLAMAMLQQTLGFVLMDHFNQTPVNAAQTSGTGMMFSAVAGFVIQLTLVQRSRWRFSRLILLGVSVLSLGYFLVALSASILQIYAGMALVGMGMGCAYPSITTQASIACHPHQRATVTGLMTAAPAMGYTIGPPVAAGLYAKGTFLPLFASLSVSILLMLMAVFLVQNSSKTVVS